MITERPDIDLDLLKEHFVEYLDYTKEVIVAEIEAWRNTTDFLCLVSENGEIDGFLIGWRVRDSFWLAQVWNKYWQVREEGWEYTKNWARERGMTSICGETTRNEIRAMKRFGFKEFSVIMECKL